MYDTPWVRSSLAERRAFNLGRSGFDSHRTFILMQHGVYQIRNKVNGKRYIGSVAGNYGFRGRWMCHLSELKSHKHHSRYLQQAWNKHGEDAFVIEILLYCDPENCLTYEQIVMDCVTPEYNMSPTAGNTLGVRYSEAVRKKMSLDRTGVKRPETSARMKEVTRGEGNPRAKLTDRKVRIIKRALRVGVHHTTIANRFNIGEGTVRHIHKERQWTHIKI